MSITTTMYSRRDEWTLTCPLYMYTTQQTLCTIQWQSCHRVNKIIITHGSDLKLRQELSTTSMMVLAASLSLRVGRNRVLKKVCRVMWYSCDAESRDIEPCDGHVILSHVTVTWAPQWSCVWSMGSQYPAWVTPETPLAPGRDVDTSSPSHTAGETTCVTRVHVLFKSSSSHHPMAISYTNESLKESKPQYWRSLIEVQKG